MERFGLGSLALATGCALSPPPPPATSHLISTAPASTRTSPARTEFVDTIARDEVEPLWMTARRTRGETRVLVPGEEAEAHEAARQEYIDNMNGRPTPYDAACPLVYVPPRQSVDFQPGTAAFAWNEPGECTGTDWPTSATPWLVLDRDGNGSIDSGAELFGTGTRLPDGPHARHGFEALAALDDDADGAITPDDAAWEALRLWSDANGDRKSSPDELTSLDSWGLRSLSLDYATTFECDAAGNCLGERASVGGTSGALVDVYLRCRT